ncbi:MAG: hypothetical protein FJX74_05130 [Armatimonadetes bacterium]|nr:hypothetical protein [Armatimonadota bacterium]
MFRGRTGTALALAVGALLLQTAGAPAQGALTATLDASGIIRLSRGGTALAVIELNAHGPDWKHAPQADAAARASDLPAPGGKQFVGALPIPNTNGGALEFTQTVTPIPEGLRLEYDIAAGATMRLNGLQLSILLPVDSYAGQEVVVSRFDAESQIVGLPQEPPTQGFQLWFGEGAKIEIAKGAEGAATVELRAPTDVVIQDLRQWEQSVFEVRFPAIMEEQGREVTQDDRFHLDLTVAFPEPVKLQGP